MRYNCHMDQVELKKYYKVLCADFPEWLNEYINTSELQTQKYIHVTCGPFYTRLFKGNVFYSSFDHSVAVALIVWHFTHDKKQTLAGLFHDISTPAFKHCVDFMNGDHLKQESTEDLTTEFIKKSKDVMALLKRNGIKLEEIENYHIYPIADNDTPKLSADRLEYSLSNALFLYDRLALDEVKEIYDDIEVQKNEFGEIELGFKTKAIARKFVKVTSEMSVIYRGPVTTFSMQFIADVLKHLEADGKITVQDLYDMKESEVIEIIEKSKYKDVFNAWRNATEIHVSKTKPEGVYSVHEFVKVRYIDPLFKGERMSKACKLAAKMIAKNLAYDMDIYIYLDFDFK